MHNISKYFEEKMKSEQLAQFNKKELVQYYFNTQLLLTITYQ